MDDEMRIKHGRGQYLARQSSLFAYMPPSPWHGSNRDSAHYLRKKGRLTQPRSGCLSAGEL
jgi:hypothetical protein